MRGTRWLILVAILAILGGVGVTYRLQQRILQQHAPPKPKPLPRELNSTREDWHYSQSDAKRTIVEIQAKKFGQSADNSHVLLEDVELRIFHQDGSEYDLVHSAQAEFSPSDKRLFSEGQVEITLGLPAEGQPTHTPVSIRSSGVTFYSDTGKAETERPASFTFEHGDGTCVGASYDPSTRELHMNSQAVVNWKAPGPHAKPMKIEAGTLVYKEASATIWLIPWARLTRENTLVEAGPTTVTLQNESSTRWMPWRRTAPTAIPTAGCSTPPTICGWISTTTAKSRRSPERPTPGWSPPRTSPRPPSPPTAWTCSSRRSTTRAS